MTSYLENVMITLNSGNATLLNSTKKSDVRFSFTGLLKEEPDITNDFYKYHKCTNSCKFLHY